MPKVKLLLFAGAKDAIGSSEIPDFQLTNSVYNDSNMLREAIEQQLGQLSALTYKLALNEEYLCDGVEVVISDGDELAVVPPLSGG